jgi:hypothetical protein
MSHSAHSMVDELRQHAAVKLQAAQLEFEQARALVQEHPEQGEVRKRYIRAGLELDYAALLSKETNGFSDSAPN